MFNKPNIYLVYKITVKDKDGEVVYSKEKKSESFVANFLTLLHSTLIGQWVTVVDINGNEVTSGSITASYSVGGVGYSKCATNPGRLLLNAPEGDSSYGIVVGTGETPVSPNDYKLENQIPHGSADGQLYYYSSSVGNVSIKESQIRQTVSRVFENKGSVDVVIKEIGLVAKIHNGSCILIVRDVLSEPVTVPNSGGVVIVDYFIMS